MEQRTRRGGRRPSARTAVRKALGEMGKDGATAAQIAGVLGRTPQSVANALAALEETGVVSRRWPAKYMRRRLGLPARGSVFVLVGQQFDIEQEITQ